MQFWVLENVFSTISYHGLDVLWRPEIYENQTTGSKKCDQTTSSKSKVYFRYNFWTSYHYFIFDLIHACILLKSHIAIYIYLRTLVVLLVLLAINGVTKTYVLISYINNSKRNPQVSWTRQTSTYFIDDGSTSESITVCKKQFLFDVP